MFADVVSCGVRWHALLAERSEALSAQFEGALRPRICRPAASALRFGLFANETATSHVLDDIECRTEQIRAQAAQLEEDRRDLARRVSLSAMPLA